MIRYYKDQQICRTIYIKKPTHESGCYDVCFDDRLGKQVRWNDVRVGEVEKELISLTEKQAFLELI